MSRRYQNGCLSREMRKSGPAVWVFRYRDGEHHRKEQIGTVKQMPARSDALKACEHLRGNINRETNSPLTFGELADHYTAHELPRKTLYYGEVCAGYLRTWILPKWAAYSLSNVKTVAVESWLETVTLSPGTKAKLRNLMHAIFNHAMRWEFASANPITLVRQSAKRTRVPEVLTADEIGALLSELRDPWRTAVYLAVTTGLRVSELLALKWSEVDFAAGEIHLSRGIVRQRIGEMKTEASRRPLPLDAGLADVLTQWRGCCPYNQDVDFIFASPIRKASNHIGPTPQWRNTSGPLRSAPESRSNWAGMYYVTRSEPW
jgi:integrase